MERSLATYSIEKLNLSQERKAEPLTREFQAHGLIIGGTSVPASLVHGYGHPGPASPYSLSSFVPSIDCFVSVQ